MKVAVMNFSGNVGKSVISKHLLVPRDGAALIAVETINSNEGGELINSKQFDELQEMLLDDDMKFVVDVGASNIEEFIKQMTKYRHSHNDFDYFLIPTLIEKKAQADTIGTIKALAAIGVPAKKIRVIFNKVDLDINVGSEFAALFAFAETEKKCIIRPGAVVFENEIYSMLKPLEVSIDDLLKHETDYKPEYKAATDSDEKNRFMQLILAKRLAESAAENLDAVHKVLFK